MDKLLILGGTNFIGRNLVERLIELDKYDITLFNRGKTNAEKFPGVKKIKGDRRAGDVNEIFNTKWDYVIDLSSYFPHGLQPILDGLNRDLKRYIYISSASVYQINPESTAPFDESTELVPCTDEQAKEAGAATYGARKAECDRMVQHSGFDHIVLRPALVYGRYDSTDRLYYWFHQVKKNNEILRPKNHQRVISYTYIEDLVNAMIRALSIEKHNHTYNIVSQDELSIGKVMNDTAKILDKRPTYIDADSAFLEKNDIKQFSDLPLWLDADYFTFSGDKLIRDFNMDMVDYEKSIEHTLNYYDQEDWFTPKAGMSEERQKELIDLIARR